MRSPATNVFLLFKHSKYLVKAMQIDFCYDDRWWLKNVCGFLWFHLDNLVLFLWSKTFDVH